MGDPAEKLNMTGAVHPDVAPALGDSEKKSIPRGPKIQKGIISAREGAEVRVTGERAIRPGRSPNHCKESSLAIAVSRNVSEIRAIRSTSGSRSRRICVQDPPHELSHKTDLYTS